MKIKLVIMTYAPDRKRRPAQKASGTWEQGASRRVSDDDSAISWTNQVRNFDHLRRTMRPLYVVKHQYNEHREATEKRHGGSKNLDAKFEQADLSSIASHQLQRILELLDKAQKTNKFYNDLWKSSGVDISRIKTLDDFTAAIPLVEKKDFVADSAAHPPFGNRLAHGLSLGARSDIYTTSGTSGQGVEIHAQTSREVRGMEQVYGYLFRWAGLNPGDHVFLTLPITMLGGGRLEYQGAIANDLTVYPVGNYDAKQKLQLLERFKPVALYGSTSYFGHLGAVSDKSPPCPSVRVLLTGLEGTGFSYFQRLEDQWQARVADRFGCTPMRSDFMFTCEHGIGTKERPGLLHSIDPFIYLEVIDPTTGRHVKAGEFGEIVVTSLYHFDNPIIRCRLRDGGVFHPGAYCPCGRAFRGIEVASISRMDDVKKIKGVNVFPQAVDDLMYAMPEVDEYQISLISADDLSDIVELSVMTKKELQPENRAKFVAHLRSLLREKTGLRFEVQLVTTLPRSEYKARRWNDLRVR